MCTVRTHIGVDGAADGGGRKEEGGEGGGDRQG